MDEKRLKDRIKEAVGIIGRFITENQDGFDEQNVQDTLLNLGFSQKEIAGAYRYIEKSTLGPHWSKSSVNKSKRVRAKLKSLGTRFLADIEATKIDPKAHSYLLQLHSVGAINLEMMEEIIDRALGSPEEFISVGEIRRITALLLFVRIQLVHGESNISSFSTLIH